MLHRQLPLPWQSTARARLAASSRWRGPASASQLGVSGALRRDDKTRRLFHATSRALQVEDDSKRKDVDTTSETPVPIRRASSYDKWRNNAKKRPKHSDGKAKEGAEQGIAGAEKLSEEAFAELGLPDGYEEVVKEGGGVQIRRVVRRMTLEEALAAEMKSRKIAERKDPQARGTAENTTPSERGTKGQKRRAPLRIRQVRSSIPILSEPTLSPLPMFANGATNSPTAQPNPPTAGTATIRTHRSAGAPMRSLLSVLKPIAPAWFHGQKEQSLLLLVTSALASRIADGGELTAKKLVNFVVWSLLLENLGQTPVERVKVAVAVVDKLPSGSGVGEEEGREGLAYALVHDLELAPQSLDDLTLIPDPSPQLDTGLNADKFLTLRLSPDGSDAESASIEESIHTIQLPLANTVFQTNGAFPSLLVGYSFENIPYTSSRDPTRTSMLKLDGQPMELARATATLKVRGLKPADVGTCLNVTTPLLPLTQPRAVEAALGNIVRQLRPIEEEGEVIRASAELEDVVNGLVKSETLPAGPVAVWSLIIPPKVQNNAFVHALILTPTTITADTRDFPDLTPLLNAGARLHRVMSGGGGWGKKAGLLSLSPAVSFDVEKPSASGETGHEHVGPDGELLPPWMRSTEQEIGSALGSPVEKGDWVQFFLALPHSTTNTTATTGAKPGMTVHIGTIPSSVDAMPSSETGDDERKAAQGQLREGFFGVLSEKGFALQMGKTRSMIDVPFSTLRLSAPLAGLSISSQPRATATLEREASETDKPTRRQFWASGSPYRTLRKEGESGLAELPSELDEQASYDPTFQGTSGVVSDDRGKPPYPKVTTKVAEKRLSYAEDEDGGSTPMLFKIRKQKGNPREPRISTNYIGPEVAQKTHEVVDEGHDIRVLRRHAKYDNASGTWQNAQAQDLAEGDNAANITWHYTRRLNDDEPDVLDTAVKEVPIRKLPQDIKNPMIRLRFHVKAHERDEQRYSAYQSAVRRTLAAKAGDDGKPVGVPEDRALASSEANVDLAREEQGADKSDASLSDDVKAYLKKLEGMSQVELANERESIDAALNEARRSRRQAEKAIRESEMPHYASTTSLDPRVDTIIPTAKDADDEIQMSPAFQEVKKMDFVQLSKYFLECRDRLLTSKDGSRKSDLLSHDNMVKYWARKGFPPQLARMLHEYHAMGPEIPDEGLKVFGRASEVLPFAELRAAAAKLPPSRRIQFWRKWHLLRSMGNMIKSQARLEFVKQLQRNKLLEKASREQVDAERTMMGDVTSDVNADMDVEQFRSMLFRMLGKSIRTPFHRKHRYWAFDYGLKLDKRNELWKHPQTGKIVQAAMQWIARLNYRTGDAVASTILDSMAWQHQHKSAERLQMLRLEQPKLIITFGAGDTEHALAEFEGVRLMHTPDYRSVLLSDDATGKWRSLSEKSPWEFLYRLLLDFPEAWLPDHAVDKRGPENHWHMRHELNAPFDKLAPIFQKFDDAIRAHGDKPGLVQVDIGAEIRENFPRLLRKESDLREDMGLAPVAVKLSYGRKGVPVRTVNGRLPIIRERSKDPLPIARVRGKGVRASSNYRFGKPLFRTLRVAPSKKHLTSSHVGKTFESAWRTSPNTFAWELMEKKLRAKVDERIKARMAQEKEVAVSVRQTEARMAEDDEKDDVDYDLAERKIEARLDRLGIRQPTVKRLDLEALEREREIEAWEDEQAQGEYKPAPNRFAETEGAAVESSWSPSAPSSASRPVRVRSVRSRDNNAEFQPEKANESLLQWQDGDDATSSEEFYIPARGAQTPQRARSTSWADHWKDDEDHALVSKKSTGGRRRPTMVKKAFVDKPPNPVDEQKEEKEKLRANILKLLGRL